VQAVNEMGVGRGEEVCRKGCPYIRQLANTAKFGKQRGNTLIQLTVHLLAENL